MENLFVYYVSLKVDMISIEQYGKWLDDSFLKTTIETQMLNELEFCSNDKNKTINLIEDLINPYLSKLDFSLVGSTLFKLFEDKYLEESYNLENLAHQAYAIWNLLPSNIANEEPFFTLCYIDDPLSYGDKEQTRNLFHKLFNYYKI